MKYAFGIFIFGRCGCKAGLFNCFGYALVCAAIASACVRVAVLRDGLPCMCGWPVKLRQGQGNSVGL